MAPPHTQRDRDIAARARAPAKVSPQARILVVDDDDDVLWALGEMLRAEGFATSSAANGAAALVEARRALPDVVLTDLQMPLMNGTGLCQRLHEIDRDLPVIVMTGFADMQSVVSSLAVGAEDYLIADLARIAY